MKTKFATLLAAVTFVVAGAMYGVHADAKGGSAAPAPNPTAAAPAPSNNWDFGKNRGRIKRLYPEPGGVYFTFGGQQGQWQTAMNPANGYYFIPLTHPNYQSLVNLLYLAAERDWNLQARTHTTLGAGGRAEVIYLVQDFAR